MSEPSPDDPPREPVTDTWSWVDESGDWGFAFETDGNAASADMLERSLAALQPLVRPHAAVIVAEHRQARLRWEPPETAAAFRARVLDEIRGFDERVWALDLDVDLRVWFRAVGEPAPRLQWLRMPGTELYVHVAHDAPNGFVTFAMAITLFTNRRVGNDPIFNPLKTVNQPLLAAVLARFAALAPDRFEGSIGRLGYLDVDGFRNNDDEFEEDAPMEPIRTWHARQPATAWRVVVDAPGDANAACAELIERTLEAAAPTIRPRAAELVIGDRIERFAWDDAESLFAFHRRVTEAVRSAAEPFWRVTFEVDLWVWFQAIGQTAPRRQWLREERDQLVVTYDAGQCRIDLAIGSAIFDEPENQPLRAELRARLEALRG